MIAPPGAKFVNRFTMRVESEATFPITFLEPFQVVLYVNDEERARQLVSEAILDGAALHYPFAQPIDAGDRVIVKLEKWKDGPGPSRSITVHAELDISGEVEVEYR